ncbi:hypothetical protein GGI12_004191 [Dipsacomyces acuminosporus]|nr:hypothetical protein GGI12_004191 [Dipsacomyces acuminosporus]
MASVFGKLQGLVSIVVSPASQRAQSTPADFAATEGSETTLHPKQIGGTQASGAEAARSDETLRLSLPAHARERRHTDTTVGSAVTAVSMDPSAIAPPVSRQDIDKILPYRMADLERISRLHPVSKVLQQDSWDCGLACICMILRAFGYTTITIPQLLRQAKTDSIWTIDLVFLLDHYLHADFTYYTKYAGINPEHTTQPFYKEDLDEDEARVQELFVRAHREEICVVEIAIPLLDLKRFLVHRQYVAVVLVDSIVLKCITCERLCTTAPARSSAHSRSKSVNIFKTRDAATASLGSKRGMFAWFSRNRRQAKDGYLGHYILLIAYIPSLDLFLYRDPGIPEEFCVATATVIDAARSRSGTDADCIILKL